MATPKIIADFSTQLATKIAVGGTTGTILINTDDDGVTLPDGTYYFTLDRTNSSKEYIVCTKTGTNLTAIKTVSRQGVETSGVLREHKIGASCEITDFLTYKAYSDASTTAGAPTATSSVAGIIQIATSSEIDAGTATGSTGASIGITPDQLAGSKYSSQLPSVAEKASLPSISSLTGIVSPYVGRTAPSGFLLCDGSAVSRTTYAALFAIIAPTATVTITIASPAVFTATAHGLVVGDKLSFTTTGGLPSGLAVNTDYYVISAGLTSNTFQVSTTLGGSAVNTSGSQTGVHTYYATNFGKGDGSTTFNVPDFRGLTPYGYKSSDTSFDALNSPTVYVGEKTHALTSAENGPHTHSMTTYDTNPSFSGTKVQYGGANSVGTSTTSSSGSGTAHNNMPPYIVTNFIIKT